MLNKFLDKLGTMGKKPKAFLVGVWRSNKGKVSTHSSPRKHKNNFVSMERRLR